MTKHGFAILLVLVGACGDDGGQRLDDDDGVVDDGSTDGDEDATDDIVSDDSDDVVGNDVSDGPIEPDAPPVGPDAPEGCGELATTEANPLAWPDGMPAEDLACTIDADCAAAPGAECVASLCRIPYRSVMNTTAFPAGLTLTDTTKFLRVCASMEHSWIRDLQIDLIPPSGTPVTLHEFAGRTGGEVFFGTPNPEDDGVPGTGGRYCWDTNATQTMIEAANAASALPEGSYRPFAAFTALQGTPLNGSWTLRVTDLWGADDGFLFEWSLAFDAALVEACDPP